MEETIRNLVQVGICQMPLGDQEMTEIDWEWVIANLDGLTDQTLRDILHKCDKILFARAVKEAKEKGWIKN